jgi:hypothetical protein
VYQDSLEERGDGINNLIFVVDDLRFEAAQMALKISSILNQKQLLRSILIPAPSVT